MTPPFPIQGLPIEGSPARRHGAALARLGGLLTLAAGLAACAQVEGQVVPVRDYRVEHPIVLHEGERSLAVFAAGGAGAIGSRQITDIQAFAAEYRGTGQGPLVVSVPADGRVGRQTLPAIRQALLEGGIVRPVMASYVPPEPRAGAPVILKFARLKADVATECGHWPTDLGSGDRQESWLNRGYENYGCSTQNALAQQVADPLDLERARPESAIRTAQRLDALRKYDAGSPTAVQYPDENKNAISKTGGG